MVEFKAERQVLKAVWQVHSLQGLVEATSKCQALKVGWQIHSLQCLVEATSGGPPPTSFGSPKNTWGGIFHVVRWNISQKFLALPPPKNIPGLKGGDMYIWVADKIISQIYLNIYVKFNAICHAQIRVVPYRLRGFEYSRRYHKWGIGIGSSLSVMKALCNLGKAKAKQN